MEIQAKVLTSHHTDVAYRVYRNVYIIILFRLFWMV